MSEDIKQIKKDERELRRLNQLKTLGYLGYNGDATKMTLEQIEARIELQLEERKKQNADPKTPTIALFRPIDGERENNEAKKNAGPIERSFEQITSGYDALTAHIPQIRKNVVQYDEGARIIRLPAEIKLSQNKSVIRRVVL